LKIRVLVVDDDTDHRELLCGYLESEGFAVSVAGDGAQAIAAAAKSRPDIVVSDVAMPSMSGLALCKKLKKDPRTRGVPVVLMSGARKDEKEQAAGIELGADDYLLKPFTQRLLVAKLTAVLRRFEAPADLKDILETEGLKLDVQSREASLRGKSIPLTRKEFDLLTTLMRKRGRVVSVPALLESVWGYDPADYSDPHTVETHVSSLRRKLGARFGKRIVTIPTRGYRFDKA
jgi:two-component system, OmpR family, response regulator ResD